MLFRPHRSEAGTHSLPVQQAPSFVFIRSDRRFVKVLLGKIRYVESKKNYVRVVTDEKAFMVLARICDFEELLPRRDFIRVHRAYIVGLAHVESFDFDAINLPDARIPIGDSYKNALLDGCLILGYEARSRKKNGATASDR